MTHHVCRVLAYLLSCVVWPPAALGGPPYAADDPEPTAFQQYEVYLFAGGERLAGGSAAAGGIDFNYGATPDLQLTAVLPVAYEDSDGLHSGLGNGELAAKYRFLHQIDYGWDVAVFPRLFLPSASSSVGEQHAVLLLPLWVEKDFGHWSTFGGGGCALNQGGDSRNFCQMAWTLTREVTDRLRLGLELKHHTPGSVDARTSTGIGAGMQYNLSDHLHLLAYAASGVQNRAYTARWAWYASLLFTFQTKDHS